MYDKDEVQGRLYTEVNTFGIGLVVLFSLIVVILQRNKWTHALTSLPPGPSGYPLIGCLLDVDDKLPMTFMRWAERYGSVFSVRLGVTTVVVLNGYEAHKDALKRVELAGRPTYSLLRMILGDHGIAAQQYNDEWREQRNFVVEAFHRRLGNQLLEDRIQEEANALCNALLDEVGKPISLPRHLQNAVGNVISCLCFGRRFEYSDPVLQNLLQMFDEFSDNVASTSVVDFFPFLRHVATPAYKRIYKPYDAILNYAKKEIQEHKKDFVKETPKDFIDAFLARMEEDIISGTRSSFTHNNLSQGVFELFIGGINTTFFTLTWMFLYMIKYPDIQRRVQSEIDSVLAEDEFPNMRHKDKMPYTDACLKEISRHASVAWMGGPHEAMTDIELNGYVIPKGTTIFMNIWSVHYDKIHWNNPEEFRPDRFLDENGRVKTIEAYIPFSIGRRECMGKQLANMNLFLIFVSLLKKFSFQDVDGDDNLRHVTSGSFGPVHVPPKYRVTLFPRN
ncbi:cytochrome P450 2D15-like [Saccoglossus kowalevskii]|uniref:Cytochrome P450 2D15-like n=1 Tax=Saccoglossus kowalevskii TaxID=10224 RepID=A0ABM0GTD7_SACKO|nr:PREDICTED: cytochrome P450 2D15-like [Saccoglossus kowalevskii]